ncbi:hypothetical protein Tco_1520067 [Tanacetum coccineum]
MGKEVNSRAHKYNGRVKWVKSRVSLAHTQEETRQQWRKHTRDVGFALNSLTKEAQAVTSRNDSLAILECTQFDQTAMNQSPMIEESNGHD